MAASPLAPPCPSTVFCSRSFDYQAPFCSSGLDFLLPCSHNPGLLRRKVSPFLSSPSLLCKEDKADKAIRASSPALLFEENDLTHSTHLPKPLPAQDAASDDEAEDVASLHSPFLSPSTHETEEFKALHSPSLSTVKQSSHPHKETHHSSVVEVKHPNIQALAIRLRNAASLNEGKRIHSHIKAAGLDQDTYLANLCILMFHRFDDLLNARAVFDTLKYPSVVSWNCIIRSYTKFKHVKDALHLFRQMLQKGHRPNRTTFLTILGACVLPETLAEGKWIHAYIAKQGFQKDIALSNSLITMYSRCGDLKEAVSIFNKMQNRTLVSWNAIIAAYCKHRQSQKALDLFARMQQERMQPDQHTFVGMLSMFNSPSCLAEGKEVHNCIIDHGFHTELIVGNALINMYNKCGSADDALLVFKQMSERDVISWSAMIGAYAENGHGRKALQLFQEMQEKGIKPNRVTFISALSACASLEDSEEGKAVHSLLRAHGIPIDTYLGNALIYMYGKGGAVREARAVFDEMHAHDAVSWTVMLHAYASHKYAKEAFQLFKEMRDKNLELDKSHYISALDACGLLSNLKEGKELHERISEREFHSDITVGNALICMYGRCGALKDACTVFENMCQHDVVSWNVMITAYANMDYSKEAFNCFKAMQENGIEPNKLTFFGLLSACTSSNALFEGKAFHRKIIECGFDKEVLLGNALINMYGKCGAVEDALAVFDHMHAPDLTSWNAMISAYCNCRNGKGALRIFRRLQENHVKPDKVTFLSVLGACAILGAPEIGKAVHGLVRDCGWESDMVVGGALINMYSKFKDLKAAQDVFDNLEDQNVVSWTAMIDAYAKYGCHREAAELLKLMQQRNCQPNKITVVSVLGACLNPAALEEGISVHSYIIDVGFESDLLVGNALVGMYGKCQALEYACQAFCRTGQHDVVSWTALMNAFLRCQRYQGVLQLFDQMQQENVQPNQVTFVTALRACASLKLLSEGKAIHAKIMETGHASDIVVKQALIDMYHNCDALEDLYSLTS
eukprot:c18262_g1_i1 orf=172-3240(+)